MEKEQEEKLNKKNSKKLMKKKKCRNGAIILFVTRGEFHFTFLFCFVFYEDAI